MQCKTGLSIRYGNACLESTMKKLAKWIDGKAIVFAIFLVAGNFKADPRLSWIPIDLTLLFALLTALYVFWSFLKNDSRIPKQMMWVMALFFLLAIPLFWTDWTADASEKVTKLFTLTLLAAIAPFFLFKKGEEVRRLFHALTVLGMIMAIDAVTPLLSGGGLHITNDHSSGITAFGSNTIALGRSAGMALIWILILALEEKLGLLKTFIMSSVLVVVMLASGSRGPLLSVIAGIGLLSLLFYWNKGRFIVRFAGVVLIVGAVCLYSFTVAPVQTVEKIQDSLKGKVDNSELMRLRAYDLSWHKIKDCPLGIGWGGFTSEINLWFGTARQYPHNICLEVLLEGGWLQGVYMSFLFLLAMVRITLRGTSLEARALFALFFFTLINAMVSGDINDNKVLFALLALALANGGESREGTESCSSEFRAYAF